MYTEYIESCLSQRKPDDDHHHLTSDEARVETNKLDYSTGSVNSAQFVRTPDPEAVEAPWVSALQVMAAIFIMVVIYMCEFNATFCQF